MLFTKRKPSDLSAPSIVIIFTGFLALFASLYGYGYLSYNVFQDDKFAMDERAFELVMRMAFTGDDWLAKGISQAGSVVFIVVASVALLIYLLFFSRFSKWAGIYFILTMGGVSLLTKLMKSLSDRGRPAFKGEYDGVTSSFPSGHTSGAIAFYGFVMYLIAVSRLERKWKWTLNLIIIILTILIGMSRVYLGVHFFTDVVAGYLFGVAWLLICLTAMEMTLWRKRKKGGHEH
ncbi:phosphatase PAP2 family protein [Halobacillus fulvus]|nr:phosphatase PAP2 family protein [Halobacillus fulvus]